MTSENGRQTVVEVLARIYVDDLDAALPLYVALSDGAEPRRFEFGDVRLAWVGSFLLLEGAGKDARGRAATVIVSDMNVAVRAITAAGGELLDGPAPGPNGPRLIARHPDGAVIEYIQAA